MEPQICFCQSAAHQTGLKFATGHTVNTEGIDQLISRSTRGNSLNNGISILVQSIGAQVVCIRDQGIKLGLIQGQAILVNKLIDRIFMPDHVLCKKRLGLLHRNTLRSITLQVFFRAFRAKSNRPLGVIPVRYGLETLNRLDHIHNFLAGSHIRGSIGINCK